MSKFLLVVSDTASGETTTILASAKSLPEGNAQVAEQLILRALAGLDPMLNCLGEVPVKVTVVQPFGGGFAFLGVDGEADADGFLDTALAGFLYERFDERHVLEEGKGDANFYELDL